MATSGNEISRQQAIIVALARLTGAENEPTKTDVEFIHALNPRWPISKPSGPIRISLLDSSFNPPTKAHLALASSCPPRARHISPQSKEVHEDHSFPNDASKKLGSQQGAIYDAHMLLLSVTNADKKLKQGDATYDQRLEMMILLSEEIQRADTAAMNICVAAIDEPTFVGKSRKLRQAITSQIESLPNDQDRDTPQSSFSPREEFSLYFVLGFDTVTRLFDPRYYGSIEAMRSSLRSFFTPVSEGGLDSYVVCARRQRSTSMEVRKQRDEVDDQDNTIPQDKLLNEEELQFFLSVEVRDYWESGRVSLMKDIDPELQAMSSTLARNAQVSIAGRNEELRRLLPVAVVEYVLEQALY